MLKRQYEIKNRQLLTLIIALAIVLCLMLLVNKCSHRPGGSTNPLRSEFVPGTGDTLNVAIEMSPSIYKVVGDTIIGRDYEILQRISREHGIPIKYYPFVPLSAAMDGLDNGKFDLMVASLPMTTSLKERYLMTEPVYLDREILVQLDDSVHPAITSQMQLAGDTVWITEQSPFRSRISNLADEIGDTIYIESSPEYSSEALFILTAKGIIPYAVVNERIAKELHPHYPNVDISTPISFTQFQSWAMRKDNQALCDSLNSWIKGL